MAATSIIGVLTDSEGVPSIALIDLIRQSAAATGDWTVLQWNETTGELILRGAGYPGSEEIYIGFIAADMPENRSYQIRCAAFSGYVDGNAFTAQPGFHAAYIDTHNRQVAYFISITPQRIAGFVRIYNSVWEHFYLGFINRYSLPSQLPYPMLMATSVSATTPPWLHFTETGIAFPYIGTIQSAKLTFRDNNDWRTPSVYPFTASTQFGAQALANEANRTGYTGVTATGDVFPLVPIILYDSLGLWGELEGVYACAGYDVMAGDTLVVDGVNHVVAHSPVSLLQRLNIALRMD
jgi:hypothetical protein